MTSLRRSALFLIVATGVILLDQLSKWWVMHALAVGESWPSADTAIGRYFSLTHVGNTGVAFGLFQGRSDVFIVITNARRSHCHAVRGLLRYQRKR